MTDREILVDKRRDNYGTLRVTENREGYRFLYFGEQTEQSCVFITDPAWLEYDYTRAMLLGTFWCGREADMTLLGLGGGALANCLVRHFAPHTVSAVELRGEVLAMAREWLGLSDDPQLQVSIGCAEKHVAAAPASCDLLFVDLYMEGGLSRLQLQAEFFRHCQQALRPGGVLVINQWQMGDTGLPYAAPLLRDLFGDDYLQVQVEEGNIILFIPAAGDPPLTLDRSVMTDWAAALEPALGYALKPYINDLCRARDNPGPL
ncbi:spermidine synthase [Halopseudomonas litoralis]|nr:methyltransferase domain-containing protein [Halopseudomonas litoralis]